MTEVEQLIVRYGLRPLPREGGWFSQVWRSDDLLRGPGLPSRYGGMRPAGTAMLYLLAEREYSALHRLPTDEVWHFHAGDAAELLLLAPAEDDSRRIRLGSRVLAGEVPQAVVPRGWWQGARLVPGGHWALLGCTLAPGWDEADIEMGERAALRRSHPRFATEINALTRGE